MASEGYVKVMGLLQLKTPRPATGQKLDPGNFCLNLLYYFVITSYFWSQGFLRKAGNQSFCASAVGINRSSHILFKVATSHCKIFHINSLSASALKSKKVGQMTSNWYVTYFQTVELSIPQLNFLGLLNAPYINYIKLQEFMKN